MKTAFNAEIAETQRSQSFFCIFSVPSASLRTLR